MKPTVNKIFLDRRASKPRWYCMIQGGKGVNSIAISGSGLGCSRWIAIHRAKKAWRKTQKGVK